MKHHRSDQLFIQKFYRWNKGSPPVQLDLSRDCSQRLLWGYFLGRTRKVCKDDKLRHKKLGLLHLFTPSGLHLSSFLLPLTLLAWFGRWPGLGAKLITFLFCLSCFFPSGFYSLKRMAGLRLLFFLPTKNKRVKWFYFFIVFAADYFWGSYSHSPLSLVFSFMFLGVLISSASFRDLFWGLLLGQVVCCLVGQEQLSLIGVVIGLFLSSLFTLLFPIILLSYITVPSITFTLVQKWHWLLILFEKIAVPWGITPPSCFLLFALMALYMKRKFLFLVFLLILPLQVGEVVSYSLSWPKHLYATRCQVSWSTKGQKVRCRKLVMP